MPKSTQTKTSGATTPSAPSQRTQTPDPHAATLVRPPSTIDGETLPLRDDSDLPEFDSIDAMTRLLLGGAADFSDLFLQILEKWEEDVVNRQTATIVEQEEDVGDILRYLIIGLAFQSQRQVRSTTKTVGSWLLGAADTTLSITRPVRNSWLFSPARRVTNSVTSRLEDNISELVRTGRSEEFMGRLMAETALVESVDWVMDYIAHNPQIRDLVQQQALGFTEEISVAVRARSVSADNIIDGVLRKLLRRTPRTDLPGPPAEVRQLEERYNRLQQSTLE